jgi:hypothetical protein
MKNATPIPLLVEEKTKVQVRYMGSKHGQSLAQPKHSQGSNGSLLPSVTVHHSQ